MFRKTENPNDEIKYFRSSVHFIRLHLRYLSADSILANFPVEASKKLDHFSVLLAGTTIRVYFANINKHIY